MASAADRLGSMARLRPVEYPPEFTRNVTTSSSSFLNREDAKTAKKSSECLISPFRRPLRVRIPLRPLRLRGPIGWEGKTADSA